MKTRRAAPCLVLIITLGCALLLCPCCSRYSLSPRSLATRPANEATVQPRRRRAVPATVQERERLIRAGRQAYAEWDVRQNFNRPGPGVNDTESLTWQPVATTLGSGKMGPIAPHPTIIGTLFAAADGGGLWKTTDNGNTWLPLTDGLAFLVTTSLAIAPSNPSVIYLGTDGFGIVKSTDGGATWLFLDSSAQIPDMPLEISVNPLDPNDLVVASLGLQRSTDGGATWTSVVQGPAYGTFTSIARPQSSPGLLYAASVLLANRTIHILKSTDDGVSWLEKGNGWSGTNGFCFNHVRIALSPANPDIVYASTVITQPSGRLSHIFKTTDGAEAWTDLQSVAGSTNLGINSYITQPDRNQAIVVSPTDPNTVIAGGLDYIGSTDGGATWQVLLISSLIHVDAVDLKYQANTLWIGNDGGIWSSVDNGSTSSDHNSSLATREYYAFGMDTVDTGGLILAGSQDNGIDMRVPGGTTLQRVFFGDGILCKVNPDNPAIAYVSLVGQGVYRTESAGSGRVSWTPLAIAPPSTNESTLTDPGEVDEVLSIAIPFLLDPVNRLILYEATPSGVLKSTDAGTTWSLLPTTVTSGPNWNPPSLAYAIAVAPSEPSVILVSKPGLLYRSTDAGLTWLGITPSGPVQFLTQLEFDPTNPAVVFGSSVFGGPCLSTDQGYSWTKLPLNLPVTMNLYFIHADTTSSSVLYCGTDLGLYRSTDRGSSWSLFGGGLPNAPVQELQEAVDGSVLRVATYGRGIWELQLHPPQPLVPQITSASISGKQLIVGGNSFDSGATILVDDQPQNTANDSLSPRSKLVAKKGGKKIHAGRSVTLKVVNSNGQVSAAFPYVRPQT